MFSLFRRMVVALEGLARTSKESLETQKFIREEQRTDAIKQTAIIEENARQVKDQFKQQQKPEQILEQVFDMVGKKVDLTKVFKNSGSLEGGNNGK